MEPKMINLQTKLKQTSLILTPGGGIAKRHNIVLLIIQFITIHLFEKRNRDRIKKRWDINFRIDYFIDGLFHKLIYRCKKPTDIAVG